MDSVFFSDLGIPAPDINLGVGSDSGVTQTARMMMGLEAVFASDRPDLLIVVGDVNSQWIILLVTFR